MTSEFCCPLCAGTEHSLLHQTRGGIAAFNQQKAAFHICHGCGLVFRFPLPTALETLHNFYEVEYWQAPPPTAQQVFQLGGGLLRRWKHLQATLGWPWPDGTVVDVGCGFGHLTATLAHLLPDCQIVGLEPSLKLVKSLQSFTPQGNIEIQAGSLETFTARSDIKAFVLMTVFEHILDARAALRKLHDLLAPEGWLVIELPDVMEPSRFGLDYFFRDFHLFYYSDRTLSALLRQCGFEVVRVERGGAFRNASGPTLCVVARKAQAVAASATSASAPATVAADPAEAARIRTHITTFAQAERWRGPLRYLFNYKVRLPLLRSYTTVRRWLGLPTPDASSLQQLFRNDFPLPRTEPVNPVK